MVTGGKTPPLRKIFYILGGDIMGAGHVTSIVWSAIMGAIAIFSFFIAYRQHKEKGFIFAGLLFATEFLYASKKEREEMDERIKKAVYRVARNVFFLIGVIFMIYAVNFHLEISWLFYIGHAVTAIIVIYAIYKQAAHKRLSESIESEKKNNRTQ